jgi:hypothetical protein
MECREHASALGRGPLDLDLPDLCDIGRDAEWVRRVLLHEMCHLDAALELESGQAHGPSWRTAMLRLQEQGEGGWVLDDSERTAKHVAEEEEIMKLITQKMAQLDPNLTWESVAEILLKRLTK